jgi:hypothetical protein
VVSRLLPRLRCGGEALPASARTKTSAEGCGRAPRACGVAHTRVVGWASLAQSTATHLLHPHVRVRAEAVLTHDGEVTALPAISFRVAKEAMRHSSDCLGEGTRCARPRWHCTRETPKR